MRRLLLLALLIPSASLVNAAELPSATLSAADFIIRDSGTASDNGWTLSESGSISTPVIFGRAGFHTFVIMAKGEGEKPPALVVSLDETPVFSGLINATEWTSITFVRQSEPGDHEITIALDDDSASSILHLRSLTIVGPGPVDIPTLEEYAVRQEQSESAAAVEEDVASVVEADVNTIDEAEEQNSEPRDTLADRLFRKMFRRQSQ